jgi:hypothetical protein
MKLISLALGGLFLGISAFASCPDLRGSFACPDKKHTVIRISQSSASGITTYKINEDTFVADGVTRGLPNDPPLSKNETLTFSCHQGKLDLNYTGDLHEGASFQNHTDTSYLFSRDASGSLIYGEDSTVTLTRTGYVDHQVHSMKCVRN